MHEYTDYIILDIINVLIWFERLKFQTVHETKGAYSCEHSEALE